MSAASEPIEPIEGDRDIPSVAQRSGGQIAMIAIFLIVCAAAAIFVVIDGMEENSTRTLTTPDDEQFETNRGSPGQPFITPEPRTPLPVDAPAPNQDRPAAAPTVDPFELERLRAELERRRRLEEEGLRLAREEQERLKERMRSPQLIVSGSTAGQATTPAGPASTGANQPSLLGGNSGSDNEDGDPNQRFLEQRASAQIQRSSAVQLENIDALVPQGTLIGAILESAIQSDLPGQIRAVVSENTYSMDQTRLLIPRGSKLIGSYRSGIVQGQTRIFVVWERLLRADGVSIQIGSVGTDALGRSGVPGKVDTHFFKRFGSSILLSLIDGALAAAVAAIDNDTAATIAVDGGGDFSRAAEIALENSINIPPTIHVNQGKRIKVFVGRDLDFSQVLN